MPLFIHLIQFKTKTVGHYKIGRYRGLDNPHLRVMRVASPKRVSLIALALSVVINGQFAMAQEPTPIDAAEPAGQTLKQPAQTPRQNTGSMHLLENEGDHSFKLYLEGERSLNQRKYESARSQFEYTIKEINRGSGDRGALERCKLGLAGVNLALERNHQAYESLLSLSNKYKDNSKDSAQSNYLSAQIYSQLAEAELRLSKSHEAESHAKLALSRMTESSQGTPAQNNLLGLTYGRLARALVQQGLKDEAKDAFARARQALAQEPGYKELDLADLLRHEALFYRDLGSRKISGQLFLEAQDIKNKANHPQKPSVHAGQVQFVWEPGSPHSHEIIDQDFPLRYITVNNIRVAVTVIDLWELAGVLVCVTNTDEHRHVFGLGDVKFYKVEKHPRTANNHRLTEIPLVDHRIIDRIRRERIMWDLTLNRPWLANMQKSRSYRGLVPQDGHDLFRGPNVFGVWGEWPGISHVVPTRIGVLPSRENILSDEEDEDSNKESGLIRSEGIRQVGLQPISMEPLESRTGELFFLYPRDQDVQVDVTVGNTIFKFPFRCRKRRIN